MHKCIERTNNRSAHQEGKERPEVSEDLVSKPINEMIRYDPKTMRLQDSFLNIRMLALDTDFYKGLRDKLFERFDTGAVMILYSMGLGYGELMGRKISEMGVSNLEVYKRFTKRGNYTGMGRFHTPLLKLVVSGLKGEPMVRLEDSFFADAAGKTGQAECHIIRGMIVGAARLIMKGEFQCSEVKCLSKGDRYCEFHLIAKNH